jgi:hypothetical protein
MMLVEFIVRLGIGRSLVQRVKDQFPGVFEAYGYSVKCSSDTSITVQFVTFLLPATLPLVLFKESDDTSFTDLRYR